MFFSPSVRLSPGWLLRGSAVYKLLWLGPPFICRGKRWKHFLHKLAIWKSKIQLRAVWFEHLGKTCLKHKDWEAFCPLMSVTSENVIDLCGLVTYEQNGWKISDMYRWRLAAAPPLRASLLFEFPLLVLAFVLWVGCRYCNWGEIPFVCRNRNGLWGMDT